VAGLWVWSSWYCGYDHTETLLAERSRLMQVNQTPLADSAGRKRVAFELTDERGRRTRGMLLHPPETDRILPVLLVLGGYGTGAKAAGLIELPGQAILCSMDYPDYPGGKITLLSSPAIISGMRRAVLDAVGGLFTVMDYLSAREEVDTCRITVVGASLGVPFAVIGAGLDTRVDALALVYGAGGFDLLFDWNLRRKLKFAPARFLATRILATAAAPFEPADYIGRLAPRPLLMVNSDRDERIPRPCVEELFSRAGEPKTMRWLATAHIHPTNRELIDSLTVVVSGWLEDNAMLPNPP
jgi:hypothetical protein